ncbi:MULTISPECIES: hypothetical protein [Halomonas]|uniref:Uncharacterized protein n=2 Tax=Halomonas TaxID=2745 RepID=A0A7X5AMB4_9GAMM|nr:MULTISPECIES: hypothetical protein [Halomonas]MDR5902704.1 hypothetical protein [Halomonas icarae]NAW13260.1 hypothetical protein [Halomonas icarae]TDB01857.1 hypothetical protein E0702_11665 [Halomonas marinisediminis]
MSSSPQLRYHCIFLEVSFRELQERVNAQTQGDDTPCWLDARTLTLLTSELERCRRDAQGVPEMAESLGTAVYHAGLLLAQCPGALGKRLCLHHLQAIRTPLQETIARLEGRQARSQPGPMQRLRYWLSAE